VQLRTQLTREYPTTSYVKIADQVKLFAVPATANQVRGAWLRSWSRPTTGCCGWSEKPRRAGGLVPDKAQIKVRFLSTSQRK